MSPSPVPETGYICLCQSAAVFALTLRMQKKTYYQRCVTNVACLSMCSLKGRYIYTSNFQEQGKTPGLPAGVCSSEASSGTSKGQQREAGTTRGKPSAKMSAFRNRGPRAKPKNSNYPSPVRSPPSPLPCSHPLVLIQALRAYNCELILRSRDVDPQRDRYQVQDEENAQKHFWEKKDELSLLFPHIWKDQFKICVDEYINERLKVAKMVSKFTHRDKEEDRRCLHSLRRFVAGAHQEWELVQQPEYAYKCAKIDGALIWQGRG